jgi:Domain of unknown function (DUF4249)
MFKNFLLLILVVSFVSCEKDINVNLKSNEPVLVVDAQIENGNAPVVVLTKSLDYFSQITPSLLASSFVRNADVYVSNGTLTHKLKEYALPINPTYTAYFYSNDILNPSTAFVGQLNTNYTLRIVTDGKEYTSKTSILNHAFKLDSIWTKVAPQNTDTLKRILYLKATDPLGLGNSGRYFTKKNSEPFYPGENSVFDDQIVDGTTITSIVPQGIDRNDRKTGDSTLFAKGDTITLKYCNIDRASYTFWNTWEFSFQSIGNPFAQPNKVLGNISNGALGAFCGYAVQLKTIIAQ